MDFMIYRPDIKHRGYFGKYVKEAKMGRKGSKLRQAFANTPGV